MVSEQDITIELRLAKPDAKLKAFADVTLTLGESGTMTIAGFSVIGDPPRVVPPARKGEQRYFEVVLLTGKLKTLVYTLIGVAYRKAQAEAGRNIP
jgi:hypothetical protein